MTTKFDHMADAINATHGVLVTRTVVHAGRGVEAHFANGWGASVVSHQHSYGGPGAWEIAVLDTANGHLSYSTDITDDVIGHLSFSEALAVVEKIVNLSREGRHTRPADQLDLARETIVLTRGEIASLVAQRDALDARITELTSRLAAAETVSAPVELSKSTVPEHMVTFSI